MIDLKLLRTPNGKLPKEFIVAFEKALSKAWRGYCCGSRAVDAFEENYTECAYAKGFREGFIEGAEWYRKNVWHPSSEKPVAPSRVVLSTGLMIETLDFTGSKHSCDMLRIYNKWAYLNDLI